MPYLDETAPQVSILNPAERIAIGKDGGSFKIKVSDQEPGLDEVIVRIRQLREDHQLLKKQLKGEKSAELMIQIPAIKPDEHHFLSEGAGELEIVAFDRSFYNNKGIAESKAFVDIKMPRVEPLTTQHNLRQGGSQLVFYFADDENLKYSGVKVGNQIFPGFKASLLDPVFAKKGIYAALYSVPIGSDLKPGDLELVAEDVGGNQTKAGFYNKIFKRSYRYIRSSNSKLIAWLGSFEDPSQSKEIIDQQQAEREAKGAIDAAEFTKGFARVDGTALVVFGDKFEQGKQLAGDSFIFAGLSRAKALQQGEVVNIFKHANGLYTVKVQHALGLSTEYTGLNSIMTEEGQQVRSGQELGNVAEYLKLRTLVGEDAVDPTEWWAQDWLAAHLIDKISQTKRTLGIIEE